MKESRTLGDMWIWLKAWRSEGAERRIPLELLAGPLETLSDSPFVLVRQGLCGYGSNEPLRCIRIGLV